MYDNLNESEDVDPSSIIGVDENEEIDPNSTIGVDESEEVDPSSTIEIDESEVKRNKKKRKNFVDRYIKALLQASNSVDVEEKLSKLGLEVGLFLLNKSCKGERRRKKFFYKDLNKISIQLKEYTGRFSAPTKPSMSEALTLLRDLKLIDYKYEKPNKAKVHGINRGIKIEVLAPSVFFNQIQKDHKE